MIEAWCTFSKILYFKSSGLGRGPSSKPGRCSRSKAPPRTSRKISAIFSCCSVPQWISIERIRGYGVTINANLAITEMTSWNLILLPLQFSWYSRQAKLQCPSVFDDRRSVHTIPAIDLNASAPQLQNSNIAFDAAFAHKLSTEEISVVATGDEVFVQGMCHISRAIFFCRNIGVGKIWGIQNAILIGQQIGKESVHVHTRRARLSRQPLRRKLCVIFP